MPRAPFVLHRDILYRRVWSKPAKAVARDLGISIASLIRICEKLAIPHPTRGYWARHEAGLENPAPLPPAGDGATKHEFDLDKSVRFYRPSLGEFVRFGLHALNASIQRTSLWILQK